MSGRITAWLTTRTGILLLVNPDLEVIPVLICIQEPPCGVLMTFVLGKDDMYAKLHYVSRVDDLGLNLCMHCVRVMCVVGVGVTRDTHR